MSTLNHSGEESSECPLCMETLEMDDLSFYPCTCGYQICRFCWHRIRTDENGLCPACRKAYPENPADFKPLSTQEMHRIKAEKRQKDQQKKQKATENRKHLANVRVVQRNLVFVVGLSPRLADPEVLKRHEYFGKLGKIHKVVINHSTQYAGSQGQGPSASAYVTYIRGEDALRAIQSVNNIVVDGRTLRASLGTTKYCSHFMKNQACPKPDCMYLHEIGDEAASFTKEEMQQGKHTDYERLLHEQLYTECSSHKEGRRKASASPPLKEGATVAPQQQSGPKEVWPSLPGGVAPANSSSLNASGKGGTAVVKTETTSGKEKGGKVKGKSQNSAAVATGTAAVSTSISSSVVVPSSAASNLTAEDLSKTNGSNRKPKEPKMSSTPVALIPTPPVPTTPTKPERQRSTSLSPVLSTSSNPTPPPISSSSSPSSSQDSCYQPSIHAHIEIFQQGVSLAAEEEEIDRARDEAEDYECPEDKVMTAPPSFAHPLLDSNTSNHSFFSSGPIPTYTSRSNGTSPAGWLANGAEEESMTSSLPHQSASDWQSAFTDLAPPHPTHIGSNLSATGLPNDATTNHQSRNSDDDLGFDPFHETQKALAEMLEKESISSLSNGSVYGNSLCGTAVHPGYSSSGHHVQSLYSNTSSAPPPINRHSPSTSRFSSLSSLGLGLGVGIAAQPQQQQQQQQANRTRIPPPGFNPSQHMSGSMAPSGMSGPYGSGMNQMQNRPVNRPTDMGGSSKMLPFMNNHNSLGMSTNGSSTGYGGGNGPRLYHDQPTLGGLGGMSGMGMGGSGVGVGMAPSNNMGFMGGSQNGSLSHMSGSNKLQGYGMGLNSGSMQYPNGSGMNHNSGVGLGDQGSSMKDWQDGLRALFPNANISMGNGGGLVGNSSNGGSNGAGSGNSRLGTAAFPPGLSSQMGKSHLHHQQAQQQQHHHPHHAGLQQHPGMGNQPSLSAQHGLMAGKGWRNSGVASSDWTSLDPAIVSSGGLADPRSDSPPHWLRSLEQLTETGNSPAAAHPPLSTTSGHSSSNNLFGLAGSSHYSSLPSLAGRGVVGGGSSSNTPVMDVGLNSMGSFWPPSVSHTTAPSMPPPGFSHIRPSPKTAATAGEAHKLDNL